jgi:hypothetical protein
VKKTFSIGLAALALTTWVGAAQAQFTQVIEYSMDIDYYLLNYFNRVSPMPRGKGANGLDYTILRLFAPRWGFVNHDFDFRTAERTTATDALGGTGVAFISGSAALAVNPAGIASFDGNEAGNVSVGTRTRFGGSNASLTDELVFDTGVVGDIVPLGVGLDPRLALVQGGLALSGRPLFDPEAQQGLRGFLGRTALAASYRRFVETANGTDALTTWLPSGGIEGFSGELRSATQSRETGGIDAVTLGLATDLGGDGASNSLRIGAALNLINGRVRADQVFTVAQLTQIVLELPGPFGDAFIEQKFTGIAADLGAQAQLFGDVLRLGATLRPGYTLEMESGHFRAVESGLSTGAATAVAVIDGRIADYHLHFPETLKLGGALRMDRFFGSGEGRGGLVGFAHRFLGRGTLSADFQSSKLSETTVTQQQRSLRNPELEDDFDLLNQQFENFPGFQDLTPNIPLVSGNAGLRDQDSFHVGFESPLAKRESYQLNLRLGWEEVPLGFPSLVLGPAQTVGGVEERPVLLNPDGTPQLEDVTGKALGVGLGFRTGSADFDISVRRASYEYVTWWGGAQPPSIYDPLSGDYVIGFGADPSFFAAQRIDLTDTSLRVGAALRF